MRYEAVAAGADRAGVQARTGRDLGGLLPTWDDLRYQITLARAAGAAVPDMMDTHVRAQESDCVGRAEDPAGLGVEVEEGHERGPGVVPRLPDRRILTAPDLGEFVEPLERGGLGRRGVDRLE
ncbi:hypothetical protein FHR33_009862 [Nonomuraea dietziae]|uniref:Uncharacterized protein n=1 Tax=Nonomuraea dietziae TaxID=65515 RepID=A0A7W5VLL1_9ACTN|nr:hypothetical protein [Nonomuraea dietziae]MBB3733909.1 hypothetical protein [Nonomuraea dietziae]